MVRAGSSHGLEITPVVATESDVPGAATARAVARAHAQKNCAAVILAIARLATPDLPPRRAVFLLPATRPISIVANIHARFSCHA